MFDKHNDKVYSVGKYVLCGSVVESKSYRLPVNCSSRKYKVIKHKNIDSVKRDDNLFRARAKVRQIVWCNLTEHTKLLTLTTADTVLDVKVFKRRLTTFLQAMKRDGFQLRYLGVLERQKGRGEKENNLGSIHCHLIVFNDEYIPFEIINKHWKGITDIKVLNGLKYNNKERINDMGAYVCKYITKESELEWGSHCYFCSVGLNRPLEISNYLYEMSNGQLLSDDSFYNFFDDYLMQYNETYNNFKDIKFNFKDTELQQRILYQQYHLKEG